MASMLRALAQRSSQNIVKSATPEAWETTANLRKQYIYTSMDALPARMAEASKEWSALRQKISSREVTLNDVATGTLRAVELYVFYYIGKSIGGRSIPF